MPGVKATEFGHWQGRVRGSGVGQPQVSGDRDVPGGSLVLPNRSSGTSVSSSPSGQKISQENKFQEET